jgi:flagellin
MSTVINTNMQSTIARDALKLNGRAMADAMEQLSTGKRINSASDDAAGLAISQTMTAQIRSLNTAVRNANDAVSMAQTAEGALIEVGNMLQRMRELAIQASTGTISTTQRGYLKSEATALADQIDSTIANTRWNGMQVLSEASMNAGVIVQVGESGLETATALNDKVTTTNGSNEVTITHASHGFKSGDVVVVNSQAAAVGGITLSGPYSITVTDNNNYKVIASANANAAAANGGGALSVSLAKSMFAVKGASLTEVGKSTILAAASDFDTAAEASAAVAKVDTALNAVSTARASLGVGINRLTSASDNLANIAQNATESRSRILDTDYAAATTELARTMIIQQAGTAVLAQANQRPQFVLALLR